MPVSDDQKLAMWREVLGLCRVKAGENIAVLTGENSLPQNIDMAVRASVALGAKVCRIDVPPGDAGGAFGQRLPFKFYVQSKIELDVRDGLITRIDGGFDAKYLRKHLESYNDPAAFGIAHVGWGLHPKASWGALGLRDKVQSHGMDSRSFAGNFLFSTGPNAEAGGSNHTPCHIDIPMADCSVSLDGEPMTIDGVLVAADQRLPA
jgi:hypothetical protein